MKKIIVSMNLTLDGYISGPDSELDWHLNAWAPGMGRQLTLELSKADTILLGRVTYQAMESYWPDKAIDFMCPRDDIAYAVMMNRHRKAVVTKTLEKTNWNNTRFLRGNIRTEINKLKRSREEQDKDIIIYGSGQLVTSLMKLKLVDEYQLWIHPVILGKGKPFFTISDKKIRFELLNSKSFESGVVLLHYKVIYGEKL
jgi:dihydrofolate reductase